MPDVSGALMAGRSAVETRMEDTFAFGVPTGGTVYDPETQTEVDEIDPLFTTKGYFPKGTGLVIQNAEAGGRTVLTARLELRIPWDSQEVPPGAVAECTAIGRNSPARLLGRKVKIGGATDGSQRTSYTLEVTEVLA